MVAADVRKGAAHDVSRGTLIYFISGAGLVKIGITTGPPQQRLRGLLASSPVPLMLEAVRPGSLKEERELHEWFADQRSHFEWFRRCSDLERLISDALHTYGPPDKEYGCPEFLLRLAIADRLEDNEVRRVFLERKAEAKVLLRDTTHLEQRFGYVPYGQQEALHRTASLIADESLRTPQHKKLRDSRDYV